MSESVVERVARAISASQTQGEGVWEAFVPEARTAIRAMREPSHTMIEAAGTEFIAYDRIYQRMIDAALKE